ncbi:MAG TPA: LptF/LptG family permease [Longimicrobiales bacterium]
MRILTRYLLRAHLGPFLFALSVLTGLLLINTVARRFEDLAGKGLPFSVIAEVFVLSIPHVVALSLPMAVLVAVLYTFSVLAADNEITALKASGVDLVRLLLPLTVTGAILAAGMVWFNDRVLPESNHRLANLLVDIGRKSPTLELKEQTINEIQTGDLRTRYFLQAAKIEPATNRLRDVVIYDMSSPERDRTIYADSGRMAFNQDRTDLFLTLYDGVIHEMRDGEPESFQRLFYDRQLIRLEGVGNRLEEGLRGSYRSDREMSLAMLRAEVEQRRKELEEVREQMRALVAEAVQRALAGPAAPDGPLGPPGDIVDAASFRVEPRQGRAAPPRAATPAGGGVDNLVRRVGYELQSLRSRAEALTTQMNEYDVEYHKKFSIPFACIVFILVGAPISVRYPRGGVGMVIAVSLTVFTIYYMCLIGGESLGDEGLASPALVMWAPNILFLGLAFWGLARIGREAATAAGGGWEDLFQSLRAVPALPLRLLSRKRRAGRA